VGPDADSDSAAEEPAFMTADLLPKGSQSTENLLASGRYLSKVRPERLIAFGPLNLLFQLIAVLFVMFF
jgi:hypothetical protein